MFKFGCDNPPNFQAKLSEKLPYMAATNELQTQLEYNAIALSGQARKSGQVQQQSESTGCQPWCLYSVQALLLQRQ